MVSNFEYDQSPGDKVSHSSKQDAVFFFTIQWTELRLYVVEIIVIAKKKKKSISFFFFSEHLTHRTICLSALSNARKNKEMRIKIILYRMKYAIRFYHFNDRTPLAL